MFAEIARTPTRRSDHAGHRRKVEAMVDRVQASGVNPDAGAQAIKEKALDVAATVKERFAGGTKSLRDYIVNEPVRALGIALGMGVILGWLIKRR